MKKTLSRKVVSWLLAICMMMIMLVGMSLTSYGADDTYSYSYAYDCYRSPVYPGKGQDISISNLGNPLVKPGKTGSSKGSWKLIKKGSYSSSYEDAGYLKTKSLVDKMSSNGGSVDVYELKNGDSHICYGVLCVANSDQAFFLGTTYSGGGAGYVFSNKELKSNFTIKGNSGTAVQMAPSSNDGFSLLDITPDHVDAGIYAEDNSGNEIILTLFHDNAGANYISMMIYGNSDDSSEVICGAYNDDNTSVKEDANGFSWTTFDITDVYTNEEYTLVLAEGNDGSVYFVSGEENIRGTYMTPDDTVNYMGAFVALIQ